MCECPFFKSYFFSFHSGFSLFLNVSVTLLLWHNFALALCMSLKETPWFRFKHHPLLLFNHHPVHKHTWTHPHLPALGSFILSILFSDCLWLELIVAAGNAIILSPWLWFVFVIKGTTWDVSLFGSTRTLLDQASVSVDQNKSKCGSERLNEHTRAQLCCYSLFFYVVLRSHPIKDGLQYS